MRVGRGWVVLRQALPVRRAGWHGGAPRIPVVALGLPMLGPVGSASDALPLVGSRLQGGDIIFATLLLVTALVTGWNIRRHLRPGDPTGD